MPIVIKAHKAVITFLGFVAGLSLACLAVLITLDVAIRNLGIGNFPWLLEISEYVLFAGTFLATPWVLRENAHVRVDLLVTTLPKTASRMFAVIAELLGLIISVILTWYASRVAIESIERGDLIFKELVVPEWPFFMIVVFTGILLMLEFCRRLARAILLTPEES